jgi:hypothetical protein
LKIPCFLPRATALALLLSGFWIGARAEELPPVPIGDDAYLQWDHWAYQRIGVRAYMRSTYDRTGGNEWADASHFLYQLADDRNVTLDVEGPGVLYFVRTNHWHGSPWHYEVDGEDNEVRESSTADPLHPVKNSIFLPQKAFPHPLALTWSQTKGSDLSWVPIAFQRSLRLAYGRTAYGTGYYIYHQFVGGTPLSRSIPSWNESSIPDPRVVALLDNAGTDIAPQAGTNGVRESHGRTDLGRAAKAVLWNSSSGPAMIRALEFSVPRAEARSLSEARLQITWDDRAQPSVDAPVALFFGSGLLYNRDNREYLVKALPMVIRYDKERVYLSCYFPMPFFRSVRFTLHGAPEARVSDVRWSVRYAPFRTAPNHLGYFHATYRDHPTPELGKDLELLDTRKVEGGGDWSGTFVGTSFIFSHEANLDTLEGDPRFFFDDSLTPQAQGTGTEEWGGGGDYWGGENMTLALAGHPIGAKDAKNAVGPDDKIESAYRFLLADLMPFGKNAVIHLEHGGEDESTEHYETVTYWYGLPAPSLTKTDELAVGDEGSERAHRYRSPNASAPYQLSSRYEWGPDTRNSKEIFPATSDRGRTTTTGSEFTLRIDPSNLGVMLRRKLDYCYPNQRAEVYVADSAEQPAKWTLAGIWYTAGSNTVVKSYGGIGARLIALDRLGEVLQQASDLRETTNGQQGPTPEFIERAMKLTTTSEPASLADLQTLRDRSADFLADAKARTAKVQAYARALVSALDEVLSAGYTPDISGMMNKAEVGPTEHLVGTSNRRFRDDEFLVPRRLTQGRSAIRVRIKFTPVNIPLFPGRPLSKLAWSEMRYTAYSFVSPNFKVH